MIGLYNVYLIWLEPVYAEEIVLSCCSLKTANDYVNANQPLLSINSDRCYIIKPSICTN